jgi:tellurite resistance protein TerC
MQLDQYWPVIVIVLQLIFLEGILSIDNAAVLGALVAPLPDDQHVKWPRSLRRLGHGLRPVLGKQRTAALRVGLLGAYVGRGAMLFLASFLISNSWIRLVGAAYLIRLAFDYLGELGAQAAGPEQGRASINPDSFWLTVLTVEVMDLIFSIDNVVAAVSLSSEIWVVLLGVAIGILAMRFAAGIFSYAVEREPVLRPAAYILILSIGIQLIFEQLSKVEINDLLRFTISVAVIVLALAYAHSSLLRKLRFVLVWLAGLIRFVNRLIDWILLPFKLFLQWLWNSARLLPGLRSS